MLFSLVVATLGRSDDLARLFESLRAQTCRDFEVLVVDQNEDDRLVPIIEPFKESLAIEHIRTRERGLSRARNVGLRRGTGTLVGFPDDDCLYLPNVLSLAAARFEADPSLAFLSGPAISPSGARGSGRWNETNGPISVANVWTSVIAFNFFIRRDLLVRIHGFDETLGVGAAYGSAEETDLALRSIAAGGKAAYDTSLNVIHPDKRLTPEATERAFQYGMGLGRVLRLHHAPVLTISSFLLRPLAGCTLSLLRARRLAASYYWKTLRGRIKGFIDPVGTKPLLKTSAKPG